MRRRVLPPNSRVTSTGCGSCLVHRTQPKAAFRPQRGRGFADGFGNEALRHCDVLVISNALHEGNVSDWSLPTPSAFTSEEVESVRARVEAGGGLWLIADHMPLPGAAHELAATFGFELGNGFAMREGHEGRTCSRAATARWPIIRSCTATPSYCATSLAGWLDADRLPIAQAPVREVARHGWAGVIEDRGHRSTARGRRWSAGSNAFCRRDRAGRPTGTKASPRRRPASPRQRGSRRRADPPAGREARGR